MYYKTKEFRNAFPELAHKFELEEERLSSRMLSLLLIHSVSLLQEDDKQRMYKLIDVYPIGEEIKQHIYDSRITEERKTEAEPNTETIS